jgi:hypothetical protein
LSSIILHGTLPLHFPLISKANISIYRLPKVARAKDTHKPPTKSGGESGEPG